MTHENGNGNGDRNTLIFKLVREFGALAVLAGMAYYILVNHSEETRQQAEQLNRAIQENTAAVSKQTSSLDAWINIMNRPRASVPNSSSLNGGN